MEIIGRLGKPLARLTADVASYFQLLIMIMIMIMIMIIIVIMIMIMIMITFMIMMMPHIFKRNVAKDYHLKQSFVPFCLCRASLQGILVTST